MSAAERNPYASHGLRDAWDHGRRTALAGEGVGGCPHVDNADPKAAERGGRGRYDPHVGELAKRVAWFEGHGAGRRERGNVPRVGEAEVS